MRINFHRIGECRVRCGHPRMRASSVDPLFLIVNANRETGPEAEYCELQRLCCFFIESQKRLSGPRLWNYSRATEWKSHFSLAFS